MPTGGNLKGGKKSPRKFSIKKKVGMIDHDYGTNMMQAIG
jgi:hypothetical protein